MATIGRPHALDEKKKTQILALLRSGCGRVTAANSVNCDPKTIVNTAKRDPEFAEKLALAEKTSELVHLDNINRAAKQPQNWRASAWMLERQFPEKYGKTNPDAISPAQITGLIVQIAEILVEEIPVAKYRQQVIKRFDDILKESSLSTGAIPNSPLNILELESSPTTLEQENNEPN